MPRLPAPLNALLVANLTINPLKANNVSRDLVRPFFGGSEQLVGTATVEVSFDVELAASGTAGTTPAWGPLLLGCAFAEAVTAGSRVDYTGHHRPQDAHDLLLRRRRAA